MSSKGEPSSVFSVRDLPAPSDFNSQQNEMPAKRQKLEEHYSATQSGNVFIWGQNDDVTDFDDEQPRRFPFPVKFFKGNAVSVACGSEHVLILSDDGRVYSWGQNDSGALGRKADCSAWLDALPDKEFNRVALPYEMQIPPALGKVLQISAGEWHSAGLLEGNMFWISGNFYNGQNESRIAPGVEKSLLWQIVNFKDNEDTELIDCQIVKISSGGNHVIVLMENGQVWGMGYAELGQLGTITEELLRRHAPDSQMDSVVEEWKKLGLVTVPIKLKTPEIIQDIFTGHNCTFVKGESGKIYSCGINGDAQLALAKHSQNATAHNHNNIPTENLNADYAQVNNENLINVDANINLNTIDGSSGIQTNKVNEENQGNETDIDGGKNSGVNQKLVDASSGNQTNIGENSQTLLQPAENQNQSDENVVFEFQEAFSGLQIQQISCGTQHTLALTTSGEIYACGNSQDGCLGIVTTKKIVFEPTLVSSYQEKNQEKNFAEQKKRIKLVCVGAEFSGCVDTDGTGFLWGNGDFYKMANKQEENVLIPMRMLNTKSFNQERIIDMSLGYRHGVVISISKERFSI